MEIEHETTVTDERVGLFQKIGMLLNDHSTTDVICALADHLALSVAFVCDSPDDAARALSDLHPDMVRTLRVNWAHSRKARDAASVRPGHA